MGEPVKPQRVYNAALRREQAGATRRRILEAARRLFVARGYGAVTMAAIAREAGVAYQTVYAVFGTKLGVARGIIWSSFEVEGIHDLIATATASPDPEVWLRAAARAARQIGERLGDLLRFLRESGDPALLAEYEEVEARRFEQERALAALLEASGRLTDGVSPSEALAVVWALSGTELHRQLVARRHWTGARYEQWLGDALIALLLAPRQAPEPPRTRNGQD
jgi:AcrR family transcriptional regulator